MADKIIDIWTSQGNNKILTIWSYINKIKNTSISENEDKSIQVNHIKKEIFYLEPIILIDTSKIDRNINNVITDIEIKNFWEDEPIQETIITKNKQIINKFKSWTLCDYFYYGFLNQDLLNSLGILEYKETTWVEETITININDNYNNDNVKLILEQLKIYIQNLKINDLIKNNKYNTLKNINKIIGIETDTKYYLNLEDWNNLEIDGESIENEEIYLTIKGSLITLYKNFINFMYYDFIQSSGIYNDVSTEKTKYILLDKQYENIQIYPDREVFFNNKIIFNDTVKLGPCEVEMGERFKIVGKFEIDNGVNNKFINPEIFNFKFGNNKGLNVQIDTENVSSTINHLIIIIKSDENLYKLKQYYGNYLKNLSIILFGFNTLDFNIPFSTSFEHINKTEIMLFYWQDDYTFVGQTKDSNQLLLSGIYNFYIEL